MVPYRAGRTVRPQKWQRGAAFRPVPGLENISEETGCGSVPLVGNSEGFPIPPIGSCGTDGPSISFRSQIHTGDRFSLCVMYHYHGVGTLQREISRKEIHGWPRWGARSSRPPCGIARGLRWRKGGRRMESHPCGDRHRAPGSGAASVGDVMGRGLESGGGSAEGREARPASRIGRDFRGDPCIRERNGYGIHLTKRPKQNIETLFY